MTTRASLVRVSVVERHGTVKRDGSTIAHEPCRQNRLRLEDNMATVRKNNRAATLLAALDDSDRLSLDRLALLAGTTAATLRACRDGEQALPPDAQVRLARVVSSRVPRLAPSAHRLEEQAIAALQMQNGMTALHLTAPAKWR